MALGLHQDAALSAGQHPDSEMVRERSGRKPDRRFLAEQGRHPRFELFHDAAARIIVDEELTWFGEACEQTGVLRRGVRNAVAKRIDTVVGSLGRELKGGQGGGEKTPAVHDEENGSSLGTGLLFVHRCGLKDRRILSA